MKKLSLGKPVSQRPEHIAPWAERALRTIERASYEDIEATFSAYTITGDFTPTRTLNTATATLPDLVALIATLITDVQKGGPNRTE